MEPWYLTRRPWVCQLNEKSVCSVCTKSVGPTCSFCIGRNPLWLFCSSKTNQDGPKASIVTFLQVCTRFLKDILCGLDTEANYKGFLQARFRTSVKFTYIIWDNQGCLSSNLIISLSWAVFPYPSGSNLEYVSSTRSPSALFARSRLVLCAPFALGEILNGFSAAQKWIEMFQKLLLLPFCRFVLDFFRDILFGLDTEAHYKSN